MSRRRFVPPTPPAPSLHAGVAEGEREDVGVETAEVNFVPLEDDFGVFSGADTDYDDVVIEDEGDVVVVEDEGDMVVVEDEGNVVVEAEGDVPRLDEGDVQWDSEDRRLMEYVAEDMEKDDDGQEDNFLWNQRFTVARFWRTQVHAYEGRILDLEKRLGSVSDGFKAAKRVAEEETAEVERLRKRYMEKISEVERLKETVADLVEQNCELETTDGVRRRNNKRRIQEIRKELDSERKRNQNLEEELWVTRKRLLTFTRCSVPRRMTRRLIRRVDSYEDGGEESSVSLERLKSDEDNEDVRMNKLIKIMDNF